MLILEEDVSIDFLGLARNRQTASRQTETSQPDVIVIDLKLTGYRSTNGGQSDASTLCGNLIEKLNPSAFFT